MRQAKKIRKSGVACLYALVSLLIGDYAHAAIGQADRVILDSQAREGLSYGDHLLEAVHRRGAAANGPVNALDLGAVRVLLNKARKLVDEGQLEQALATEAEALRKLEATGTDGGLQRDHQRFSYLLEGIKYFEQAIERHRTSNGGAIGLDAEKVEQLIRNAQAHASERDYDHAIPLLTQAKNEVTAALRGLLNTKTMVVERHYGAVTQTHADPSARARSDYETRLEGVRLFQAAYRRNAAQFAAQVVAAETYDNGSIDNLIARAQSLAGQRRYDEATALLVQAKDLTARALRQMLDSQAFVVDRYDESSIQAKPAEDRGRLEYERRLSGLILFRAAVERNLGLLPSETRAEAVYDREAVDELLRRAQDLAAVPDYRQAAELLALAQHEVAAGLQRMLNTRDFIVKLDLSTPEREYQYEYRRYLGYEELIPVALDRLQPATELLEEINAFVAKARWMTAEAKKKGEEGSYPVAIRMQIEATSQVQQALKLAGVPDWTLHANRSMMQ